MADPRDDMVIVPRIKRQTDQPVRERATEERRTRRVKKKRNKLLSRLQRAILRRSAAARTARQVNRSLLGKGAGKGGIMSKAGWMMVLSEVGIKAGESARALGAKNMSQRLIQANNAHDQWDWADEKARAKAAARSFIEGDRYLLRTIAREGKVSDHIASIGGDIEEMALKQYLTEDLIERDPRFDSRDTLQDQIIHAIKDEAARQNLKGKVDEAIHAMREYVGANHGR